MSKLAYFENHDLQNHSPAQSTSLLYSDLFLLSIYLRHAAHSSLSLFLTAILEFAPAVVKECLPPSSKARKF